MPTSKDYPLFPLFLWYPGIKKVGMKLIFLLSLGALAVAPAATATPFPDALDLGNHNRQSAWFDYFNDAHAPWYYHFDHGWLYVPGGEESGLWIWDPRLGWMWTGAGIYPHLYEPMTGWLYYARSTKEPRLFNQRSTEEWLWDDPQADLQSYYPIPGQDRLYSWDYAVNNGEPVGGTFDGVSMQLRFYQYTVTLDGFTNEQRLLAKAYIEGEAYLEGAWYDLGGGIQIQATDSLRRNALGTFIMDMAADITMALKIGGQDFTITANARADQFSQLLPVFPWRHNLYTEPIGKTFQQTLPAGWLSGSYRFEAAGFPDKTESGSFDLAFSPLPTLHAEIVDKHPLFWVRGVPYTEVVELVVRQSMADPFSGEIIQAQSRLWLARGVGVIKSEEDNPLGGEPLTLELVRRRL